MDKIAMIPTVKVTGGWETVVEAAAQETLVRAVLPDYLRAQRWFGGKGRHIAAVRFVDWGDLGAPRDCVFALILEVCFTDGNSDLYFLPIGVSNGDAAAQMRQSRQPWLIAHLTGPEGEALLHDALADDDTCMSLLTAIGAKQEFATHRGLIRAFPTAAFSSLAGDDAPSLSVVRGPATSSNSLIFYGRRLLLKMFRRLESGINPEFEMGRFLTEGHIFHRLPRIAGAIEYHRAGSEPIALAILQTFIVNQGDGWQHALGQLRHYYERASTREDAAAADHRSLLQLAESEPPPTAVEAIGGYLSAAGRLGRRTAEMHRALSADPNNPDFAPEPLTQRDSEALRNQIRERVENALAALSENLDQLPQDIAKSARLLLEKGPNLLRHTAQGPQLRSDAARIRCHGDYHLAQVLCVQDDYVIIDFEGEPMRTVAERRAKQSPLKDVAGMLRSYHNAAYSGLFAFTQDRPEAFDRLRSWAELWFQWVAAAFLHEYRVHARGAVFVPADTAVFAQLLDAFVLEKMFYELHYELNNRPDWVRIPLGHILSWLTPSEPRP
jgi:maltose alpha-D-glucosyltransferase/alpha-amylase